eukprot:TRINITY_DN859_c2_g1_i1.p1 TRINITY_DN859_c2_g1~~TRINITY_DN859_c2_g1_i1.p1  ORF type:complete len:468 (-),score=207.32 TRINITY_DN859_c2_g1_i1:394-1797(-)
MSTASTMRMIEHPLCCFGSRKKLKTFNSFNNGGKHGLVPCHFRLLSNELILYILRYLSTSELCVISRTSRRLRECAYDKTLWRSLVFNASMNRRKIVAALKMMEQTQRLNYVRMVNLNNSGIKQNTVEYIVQHAPALKEIRLHNLKMTERIAKLLVSKCPQLEQVYMDGGKTSDECLELLANGAIRLKSINLHKVENITTNGICHIIKNTNLSFLNFNGISGWDIRTLAPYCAHFTSMDLGSSNNLTDEDLKSLTKQCKKLKFISLKNCKMITDTGIEELINDCPQLTDLNLSTCSKLTKMSVQLALQSLHSLATLNLSHYKSLHPIQFPHFPYRIMPTMLTFDLSHTDITDEDLFNLAVFCPNIKNLRINGCTEITDLAISNLANKSIKLVSIEASRDLNTNNLMKITISSITQLATQCPDLVRMNLSYSSKNNITKRSLLELNDWRMQSKQKLITFNLNDDMVVS